MKPVNHDRGGTQAAYCAEVVRPILDALRTANHRNVAARIGGVSVSTFHRWMKEYPEFGAAVEEAEAECQRGLVQDLLRVARGLPPAEGRVKPDVAAIKLLLERRFHSEWKERQEVSVTVEHDDPLEELERQFRAALAARGLQQLATQPNSGTQALAEGRLALPGETGTDCS